MFINHFYVDNLVKTSNKAQELKSLYSESVKRMNEGNFQLWSCNTNCSELREKIREGDNLVKYLSQCEKLLGYEYNPYQDLLCISHFNDPETSTKRCIFFEVSKTMTSCLPSPLEALYLVPIFGS